MLVFRIRSLGTGDALLPGPKNMFNPLTVPLFVSALIVSSRLEHRVYLARFNSQ